MRPDAAIRVSVLPQKGQFVLERLQTHQAVAPESSRGHQNAVRKRRKVYSVNKSHYCPRCNRGFTLKKNMTRHLRHECGMAPKYQCPYCDKPSKFTQNIYAHIRKYHPGQALCFRRLCCHVLQYAFLPRAVRLQALQQTICLQQGPDEASDVLRSSRFKCSHCDQRAKYRSTIYNHLRSILREIHASAVDPGYKELTRTTTSNPNSAAKAAFYNRSCYIDPASTVTTGHRRRFRTRIGAMSGGTSSPGTFECPKCRKIYKWYRGLHRHLEYECGKTPRFKCPHCVYIGKHRSHVYSHIKSNHYNRPIYAIDLQKD
ncbi:PREDICTED: zinc finger Y-chromosomal protein 2-like [Vollenhovia emeryi]|uniref:zinc finger Y-chromosomal protein 2-like n=1 Tax=Vollenhovia emeryi TaxID=411798 RepID=UPI0005F373D5|nr:PREDICTED: zinc finger Y-chromosomal protein 2-like [Vollenhovia emeryi]